MRSNSSSSTSLRLASDSISICRSCISLGLVTSPLYRRVSLFCFLSMSVAISRFISLARFTASSKATLAVSSAASASCSPAFVFQLLVDGFDSLGLIDDLQLEQLYAV